jgi:TrmH family RNA methyltransferase
VELIVSKENEFFKKVKKLKSKKYREEYSLFLAEGKKFFDFDITPEFILFREDISENSDIFQRGSRFETRRVQLSEKLFKELTSQETSQGVIIGYKIKKGDENRAENNVVVLDGVSDPGNLGTILRVADAAGFKDIFLTKGSADCYNEKVVRSSMGSIFNLNIVYMEGTELLDFLKQNSYRVHTTALDKTSIDYTEMKMAEKNAFVFGNEGNGVSKLFLDNCDEKVIIPIYGTAESLNVAMASGIILYKSTELLKK